MDFRNMLIIGTIILLSAIVLATPFTTPTPSINMNSNGWYNQDVNVTLSVIAPASNTSLVTYYTLDMNTISTPLPDIVYTGPVTLTQNASSMRFFTSAKTSGIVIQMVPNSNLIDDNEQEKYYSIPIDTTPPTQALGVNNGIDGINCSVGGGHINCDLTQGIISIPNSPANLLGFADTPSGIDSCKFNFDYNSQDPTTNWTITYSAASLPNNIRHLYNSLGTKYIAVDCNDRAGNNTISYSAPVFTINVTGLAAPIATLTTIPIVPNFNGWFNQTVTVHLSGTDTTGIIGIKEVRYCILNSNLKSDGCRISNPNYSPTGPDRNRTIPKDPKDYNVFTTDLIINGDANALIKYYSTNSAGTSSAVGTAYIAIDTTPPMDAMSIINGFNGTVCTGSGKLSCNFTQGMVAIPTMPGFMNFSDSISGVDYCAFNFDYNVNNPTVNWGANIPMMTMPNPMVNVYTALGPKVIAIKCTDKAGNSTTSISTYGYDLNVTGFNPNLPTVDFNISPTQNINNWNNTPVTIHISGNDSLVGIKEIRYCLKDTNLTSDGCRVTNPNYNRLGPDRNKTIPKDVKDYNIFTSDLPLSDQGVTMLKAYSVNNQGTMSNLLSGTIQIDLTPPTNAMGIANGFQGIVCQLNGRTYDCNLTQGIVKIPGPIGLLGFADTPSGIDYCEFNFDYNNSQSTFGNKIFSADLNNGVTNTYSTLGEKIIAAKCTDKAGNQTTSISSPFIKLTVTGITPVPTCSDGIQNQGETGVDCGGTCNACPVIQPTFGGSSTYYPPVDTNKPADTNKPLDTNAPIIDANKPLDTNAPIIDTNKPLDTNRLIDTNVLARDANAGNPTATSPATGFFGLLGAGGAGSWIVPVLIILLALFLIGLWIRRESFGQEEEESEPKKKWENK